VNFAYETIAIVVARKFVVPCKREPVWSIPYRRRIVLVRVDVGGIDLRVIFRRRVSVGGIEECAAEPSAQRCDEGVVVRHAIVLRIVDRAKAGVEPGRHETVVRDQVPRLHVDVLSVADAEDLPAT
jgi:hypothetical protein